MNVSTSAESKSDSSTPETALVEVFTGDGRGKTSAALGIVLRALGHGLRVHVVFFMKGEYPYGEQKTLAELRGVSFSRFGSLDFVDPERIEEKDRTEARKGLEDARRAVMSGDYDLVILDEVNLACAWGMVELEAVAALIQEKPEKVELILTGRRAPARLIALADVVTEMKEVKHPYTKGVLSRRGVDY